MKNIICTALFCSQAAFAGLHNPGVRTLSQTLQTHIYDNIAQTYPNILFRKDHTIAIVSAALYNDFRNQDLVQELYVTEGGEWWAKTQSGISYIHRCFISSSLRSMPLQQLQIFFDRGGRILITPLSPNGLRLEIRTS